MRGAGLFKLVRNFELSNIKQEVTQSDGIFIVILPPWCVARSRGLEFLEYDIKPHYEILGDEVKYVGNLEDIFPIRVSLIKYLRNSFVFQKYPAKIENILANLFITNDFYTKYAKVLAALKRLYLKKFKNGKFVFFIYPHNRIKYSSFLLSEIEREGIDILRLEAPRFFKKD